MLLYENNVKENKDQFIAKVKHICLLLGIEPNWLMQVMMNESGLNHRAVNKNGGATGLIQFMPATANVLGTTTQNLLGMTNVEQLDYVYKYIKPFASKISSYVDLYFTIFFPIAVGKPKDWVFETKNLKASTIAKANPIFDINKDQKLTVSEVETAMLNKVPAAYREQFKKKVL